MGEITAQDSLDIAQLTSMLNDLSAKDSKTWMSNNIDMISKNPAFQENFLIELNKTDAYKGKVNIDALNTLSKFSEDDTVTTSFGSKGLISHLVSESSDVYTRVNDTFNKALDSMNKQAIEMAILDEQFKTVKKRFDDNENRINMRYTEIMQKDSPSMSDIIPGVSSYKQEMAYKEAINENPKMKKSMQVDKKFLRDADAQLGFKYLADRNGAAYSAISNSDQINDKIKQKHGLKKGDLFAFEKYKILKNRVEVALKSLNVYESDSTKTILPEEFFETYPYSSPGNKGVVSGTSTKEVMDIYNQTKIYETVKLEEL